jgi:WD40 repeat protein
MIQRRHFMGVAGAFFAGTAFPNFVTTRSASNELSWQNEIIPTVPHNKAQRRPVITGVSLRRDGKRLAIVGDDHCVGIFDVEGQKYIEHVLDHKDWVRSVAYSPDGKLLATAGNDRTLRVWQDANWRAPLYSQRHDKAIINFAFSPAGDQIATVGFEKTLRIYDTQSGRVAQKLECPCPDNHALAFSPDGRQLAVGGRCGTLRVWDVVKGQSVLNQKVHRQRIRSLAFTSAGTIISAGDDQRVKITDLRKPEKVTELPRLPSKLFAVKLLGDGLLATAGSDNKIRIWGISDRQEIGVLNGHTGTVSCLDANSGVLVSGSFDTQVRMWDMEKISRTPLERRAQQGWNGLK